MDLAALEERLGHRFKDRQLLSLALSHASIGAVSNERLEFLGDRVLGLIIAERLFADYPSEEEGGLAVRLNALVRREACAKMGEAAGLAPHLIMASSESGSGGRRKSAILAGACEAVIAALYLDGGMEAARRFVLNYWEELFATLKPELRAAKTALLATIPGAFCVVPVVCASCRSGRRWPPSASSVSFSLRRLISSLEFARRSSSRR